MDHQVQHVMDDCACNAQDDWNRTEKKTQRANGDTHQQGGREGGREREREDGGGTEEGGGGGGGVCVGRGERRRCVCGRGGEEGGDGVCVCVESAAGGRKEGWWWWSSVGASKVGGSTFCALFSSPAESSLCSSSLGVFSWNCGGASRQWSIPKCAVGLGERDPSLEVCWASNAN